MITVSRDRRNRLLLPNRVMGSLLIIRLTITDSLLLPTTISKELTEMQVIRSNSKQLLSNKAMAKMVATLVVMVPQHPSQAMLSSHLQLLRQDIIRAAMVLHRIAALAKTGPHLQLRSPVIIRTATVLHCMPTPAKMELLPHMQHHKLQLPRHQSQPQSQRQLKPLLLLLLLKLLQAHRDRVMLHSHRPVLLILKCLVMECLRLHSRLMEANLLRHQLAMANLPP